MKKAVLFDFDYTLGDSANGIVLCINYALEKLGYSAHSREEIQKTIKEVQLEPKEITALLEAYSKGIIELPDELREELEEDDEE